MGRPPDGRLATRVYIDDDQAARPRRPRAEGRNSEARSMSSRGGRGPLLLKRLDDLPPQGEVFDRKVGSPATHRSKPTRAE